MPRGPLCLYPPHLHWLLCQSFVFRFSWSSFLMLLSLQPSPSASPPLIHCCAKSFHSPSEIIEFKVFRSLPRPHMDKMKHPGMQTAFTSSCERTGHSQYISSWYCDTLCCQKYLYLLICLHMHMTMSDIAFLVHRV